MISGRAYLKSMSRRPLWVALGIDTHIAATLSLRGWSILASGAMLALIPLCLTRIEQGYYYTFASLIALQIFFELGMSQVVVQLAGHEAAHLDMTDDGALRGEMDRVFRLASLLRLLRRWYAAAALLFLLVVSAGGALFFRHDAEVPLATTIPAWLILTAATAVNIYLSPNFALLESFGRVADVAKVRLRQMLIGYIVAWALLAAGAGLWAICALPVAAAAYSSYWLRRHDRQLAWLGACQPAASSDKIQWRRDVLPLQWRIAVSWISGYFILQLFVPVTFRSSGPIEAGRLGITMALFAAIQTLGMSWVNAKAPTFAHLVSRADGRGLNRLFSNVSARATFVTLFGSLAVIGLAAMADGSIRARFASLEVVACIAAATVANTLIFASATYLRAHKEEPMLAQSVAVAIVTFAALQLAAPFGPTATMGSYAAITILLSLPWTLATLSRYYCRNAG